MGSLPGAWPKGRAAPALALPCPWMILHSNGLNKIPGVQAGPRCADWRRISVNVGCLGAILPP